MSDLHMKDQIVVITGANSGIGFVTALRLAGMGAQIILVCRDGLRAAIALGHIEQVATGQPPILRLADLSSQAAIRALARELNDTLPRIDVLINNAGGVSSRRELTREGIERTFATNHLAPWLLTNLLYGSLRAAPAARIINVTSDAYPAKLDFENLQGERSYHFLKMYFQSKLENILFTFELARRLQGTPITANCFSPGPTITRFGDNLTGLPRLFPLIMKRIPFLFRPVEVGARTSIWLASDPGLAKTSGRYFFRQREHQTKPVTHDRDVAARLWSLSAQLTDLSRDEEIPEHAVAYLPSNKEPLRMSARGAS